MNHSRTRQLTNLLATALLWSTTSANAAPRSDITIILSEDMQSYIYKESVSCRDSICLYQTPFKQTPLWIGDDGGNSLMPTNEGYQLENTSFSVMYKAVALSLDYSSSQVTLSFPLSHIIDLSDNDAVIQQRLVWALPESTKILQYSSIAINDTWEVFDNILKLETSSNPNLMANIVLDTTAGSPSATQSTIDFAQQAPRVAANKISNTSIEERPIVECNSPIALISKAECNGADPVILSKLTFDRNSASLSPFARTLLDTLVQPLKHSGTEKFEIAAYTDSSGPRRWNLSLSQDRAQTIRQYLIFKGIRPNKLVAKGYGESTPIATNDSFQGRVENRRIELQRYAGD